MSGRRSCQAVRSCSSLSSLVFVLKTTSRSNHSRRVNGGLFSKGLIMPATPPRVTWSTYKVTPSWPCRSTLGDSS